MQVDLRLLSGMLGTNLSKAPLAELCLAASGPPKFQIPGVMPCSVPPATTTSRLRRPSVTTAVRPWRQQPQIQQERPAPSPTYAMQPVAAAGSGLSENSAAAIAYITIIPAIRFLAIEPYNKMPFVRFHAFQSIGLTVVWFALWIVITMLRVVLHFVSLIGLLFLLVDLGICFGMFIVWLIAIMKASKGEWYKLPLIGDFAEKQAGS